MLYLINLVKIQKHVRSVHDRRVFVDKYIYEYRDENNQEYRISFEVKPGKIPTVPEQKKDFSDGSRKQW